jgi:cyclohexadieny/prephenate dehydrogenase
MLGQVTIIGMGLMGSSVARALRHSGLARRVIAADDNPAVLDVVHDLGIADELTMDLPRCVAGSDYVILAVPVGACGQVAAQIGPALKAKSVVMDVGSVKRAVIDAVLPHIPESVHFIPAHPIAGTEHSGPAAGMVDLFKGRWCILTPLPDSEVLAVQRATEFWESMGARIELMNPGHHDLVLGITSHLPHLIAYTIVGTASDLEEDLKSEVIKFSASGFRGFTRIAASDPVMWRDVFLNNRDAVLEILQRFTEDLTTMQKAIRRGDGNFLHDSFSRTREIRRHIIELGPEGYPSPQQEHGPPD